MALDPRIVDFAVKAYQAQSPANKNRLMEFLNSNPDMVQELAARAGLSQRPGANTERGDEQSPQINAVESALTRSLAEKDAAPAPKAKPRGNANAAKVREANARDPGDYNGSPPQKAPTQTASPPLPPERPQEQEGEGGGLSLAGGYDGMLYDILGALGVGAAGYGAAKYVLRGTPDSVGGPPASPNAPRGPTGAPELPDGGSRIPALASGRQMMMPPGTSGDPIMDAEWSDVPRMIERRVNGKVVNNNGMYNPNDPRNRSAEQNAAAATADEADNIDNAITRSLDGPPEPKLLPPPRNPVKVGKVTPKNAGDAAEEEVKTVAKKAARSAAKPKVKGKRL